MIAQLVAAAATLIAPAATDRLPPAPAIRVARPFRVQVYASGLEHPTAMAFGPRGALYVAEDVGRVVAVFPGGRPRLVADGIPTPLGLVRRGAQLYVSAQGQLLRLTVRDGRVVSRRTIVSGLPYGRHQQDNVVFGPDGRLYFGSGSTCDVCVERDPRSATILSVRPDGTGLKVVARGLRNAYGLAREPRTGRLYASVNGQDEIDRPGDPEPAEMVVEVRQGRFFGWPRCWPSARLLRLQGSCRGATPPVAYLEPHSSADGMAFWRGDLYVAEWGTYRQSPFGKRVVRVRLRGPLRRRVSVFASGFEHPLAVLPDRTGGLLVSDWGRGLIYRISRR